MQRIMKTVPEEASDNALNSTEASEDLFDGDSPAACKTKRYQVFQEFLETEENYVEVLQCIISDYKGPLDALDEDERKKILSDHEMHVLFSRIARMLETHKNILAFLKRENETWNGKNLVGHVFAHQKEYLMKDYVPYINNYDEILEILANIEDNPVADQFFKGCDARSSKRFLFKDLLIRPVQRLPSVMLLLKELLKATSKSRTDYKCIELSLEIINCVLAKSNENRRKNDHHQQNLELINNIEGFPTDLIYSGRSLQCQADFQIVHSNTPFFKSHRRSIITLFLFNDMVIMTKRRDHIRSTYDARNERRLSINPSLSSINSSVTNLPGALTRSSSMSVLKRSFSFISNMAKKERKPFKFIEAIHFNGFRQLMYIEQDGLYYLKMRDQMSDEWNTLKIAGETTGEVATKLMRTLCGLINSTTSRRDVLLMDVSGLFYASKPVHDLSADELEYVRKTRLALGLTPNSKIYENFISIDRC